MTEDTLHQKAALRRPEKGNIGLQQWTTKAMQDKQPKLTVHTWDQAQQVNEFRMQVSEFDPLGRTQKEAWALAEVQRIRQRCR